MPWVAWPMPRTLNVQTFGSIVVIGAFAAAEAASAYLAACPASPVAWYLNLAVFRPFDLARAETSPLHILFGPAALPAALGLLVVTLLVRAIRFRFGIAAIANVCFACTAALVHAWLDDGAVLRSASLLPVAALDRPDLAVIALMVASSLVAFAASHVSFARRIRTDRKLSDPIAEPAP